MFLNHDFLWCGIRSRRFAGDAIEGCSIRRNADSAVFRQFQHRQKDGDPCGAVGDVIIECDKGNGFCMGNLSHQPDNF